MASHTLDAAVRAMLVRQIWVSRSLPEEHLDLWSTALFAADKKNYESENEHDGKCRNPHVLILAAQEQIKPASYKHRVNRPHLHSDE
jgi:hypothetical protein